MHKTVTGVENLNTLLQQAKPGGSGVVEVRFGDRVFRCRDR